MFQKERFWSGLFTRRVLDTFMGGNPCKRRVVKSPILSCLYRARRKPHSTESAAGEDDGLKLEGQP